MSASKRHGPADAPRWLDGDGDGDDGRRAPLNRRRIVEAALVIIDERGLASLTIRRLAEALGVSPMAMYTHVADKAELVDLLVDWVIGDALVELDPDQDWIEQLRSIFCRARDSWNAHPGVLQAYAAAAANPRPTSTGPNALAMAENVAAVLARAGFSPAGQAQAFMSFHSFLRGALLSQPNRMQVLEADDDVDPGDLQAAFERFLGGVDPTSLPHFLAIAPHLQAGGNFDYALDVFLSGLAAKLAAGD